MTKKKASKTSIDKKAKQPHRAPIKAKHKVVVGANVGKKPFTNQHAAGGDLSSSSSSKKKKQKSKKPRRSNETLTNPSLFGAVGKSSVKVKKLRRLKQQHKPQVLQTPVAAAASASPSKPPAPIYPAAEKMNNKKKKKKAVLLMVKNPVAKPKTSKRKKQREALQHQYQQQSKHKTRGGKGSTTSVNSGTNSYHQQRGRIKIFQLPRANESRKLLQSPWFSHSQATPPPPLPTTTTAIAASSSKSPSNNNNKCRLPYPFLVESFDLDATCWDWLDYELQLFANYVRLQQVEIQARENAIGQIRSLALDLFRKDNIKNTTINNARRSWGSSGSSRRPARYEDDDDDDAEEVDDGIRVEAFGSYAAQPVCCFQSDIDLALWGVVAAPKSTPTRFQAGGVKKTAGVDNGNAAAAAANSSPPAKSDNSKKQRQEERIQRWKLALAALNDAKLKQQQLQDDDREKKPTSVKDEQAPEHSKQNDPPQTNDKESCDEPNENTPKDPSRDDNTSLTLAPPSPKRRKVSGEASGTGFFFVLDRTGVEELGGSPLLSTRGEPGDEHLLDEEASKNVGKVDDAVIESNVDPDRLANEAHIVQSEPTVVVKSNNMDLFAMGIPSLVESTNNSHLETSKLLRNDPADGMKEVTVASNKQPRSDANDNEDFVDLTMTEDGGTIDLTWDEDSMSERESSNSDDDSADKMSAFNPQGDLVDIDDDSDDDVKVTAMPQGVPFDSDDDSADKMSASHRRVDQDDMVSLSSSTTSNSDDDELDESGLEVSFVSSARSDTSKRSNDYGPKGQMKQQVISALVRLGNALRKRSWTHRLEIRKHARVPIINMTTVTGFESDIALGGHTGVDTRLYATTLASRYESFSPVVLALKILLNQQGLDQPFTGGLGSYKLYVLVAYHLERHLAKGGSDRPGEVLVSFLFRYGVPNPVACTDLCSVPEVESHGGTADMNAVYKVEHCSELFRNCWHRLNARIREWDAEDHLDHRPSFLAPLLRADDLQRQRSQCIQQALRWKSFADDKKGSRTRTTGSPQASSPSAAISGMKRKADEPSNRRVASELDDEVDDETEADRLMRGYGLQRGPDGNLIPSEA